MKMRLSRLHYPVTTLGPGRRAGIWFQGCTIRCPGCMSVDTWPRRPDRSVPVESVLEWLTGLTAQGVDGVTISGGEPTEQPEALVELIAGIDRWRTGQAREPAPDILVYSGRAPEWMAHPDAAMLHGADAVVMGPYLAEMAGSAPLRGSDNQVIVPLTELGRQRYAPDRLPPRGRLQGVAGDGLWLVGIPLPGQLQEIESRLNERGLHLARRSWRR